MAFDPQDPAHLERYSRQLILRELGPAGQSALAAGSVLMVGAGGLGAPALAYLAAAGVGRIGIADSDAVERSNLQRQILYTEADLGRPKAEAARERLQGLNATLRYEPHAVRVTPANARALVSGYDVVLDGTDNFATRFLINDASRLEGKKLVQAGIIHTSGQLATFVPEGPCYRCFFPQPPANGRVPSCDEGGVLGAVGGLVGSLMAAEAIKLLIGQQARTLAGAMLMIDLWSHSYDRVALPRDPDCPLCGAQPVITDVLEDYSAAAHAHL